MYAVGRLGGYISRGVYTVSGPFHPFGGAVDIIVVEQPDGSFKSSPWYVRFGKFQGVLKSKENVVHISLNDVEANFHMYLDNKGEAYFLRDADVEDGESVLYQLSSGDEIDVQSDSNRKQLRSKSCACDAGKLSSADQSDISNGNTVSRTTSNRLPIMRLAFGRRRMKEDSDKEGAQSPGVMRSNSLERAEMAADLLEMKWSTSLVSSRSKKNKASNPSVCEVLANEGEKDMQARGEQITLDTSVHDNLENNVDQLVLQEETCICNNQMENNFQSGPGNLKYPVEEAGAQMSSVSSTEQLVTSSSGEGFMEEKCRVISEASGIIDENDVQNTSDDENVKVVNMRMEENSLQIQNDLEACPDEHFNKEEVDSEMNVLQACGIANEESVPDRVQYFAYCETSQSSVLDVSSEQIHETLCLSCGGKGEVHIHAKTVLSTTGPLAEDMVVKQAEEMELGVEETLKITESYTQTVSVGHMVGSVKEVESSHTSSSSNVRHSDSQVQDEKSIENGLHPSLESICDPQKLCGDSDTAKSFPPSEISEEEQFLFSDIDEFKLKDQPCVNEDHQSLICTNGKEVNSLLDMSNQESPLNDLENSLEKSGMISDPISIHRSHSVGGEKDGWLLGSLPNMWSPDDKSLTHNNCPLSHSLDSNSESLWWTSVRKNDSSCIKLVAVKELQLGEDKSNLEDTEASMVLKEACENPAIEISLCKHLLNKGMGADAAAQAFDSEKLDMEKFNSLGPTVVKHDKLVVRICGHYFPWDAAAPILLGMVTSGSETIFEPKGMIPVEKSIEENQSKAIDSSSGSWKLWPFSFKGSRSNKKLAQGGTRILAADNADDDKNEFKPKKVKTMVRAITPTSKQLASLNLKEGRNAVTFTFSTAMLGKQQVDARIFLWKWNTRIVISDVDGTITKSDVLGQFMPLVGMDWSQTGVAHLFSAIKENGYELLFLSARSISQAYHTRQFLVNLKQDGKALPDGPIVISPDGLFPSLFREVIRRAPHEFKIACLEDIKALFPSDCNPFYAGFGNRDTDEISYLKVGIPKGKIFIINPKGEVAVNRRLDTKSYSSLHALVHGIFPTRLTSEQEDFNSWNYWKLPPPEIKL